MGTCESWLDFKGDDSCDQCHDDCYDVGGADEEGECHDECGVFECCSDSGSGDGGIECVGMLEIIIPAVRAQVMEECGTTSLIGIYSIPLHDGSNLVSFWGLPESTDLSSFFYPLNGNVTGVIGEGTAAMPDTTLGWIGSINYISSLSGYWLIVNESDWFNITARELTPLDTAYQISTGSNLVSWPSSHTCAIGDAIPDEFEENVCGIIGEGVAAIPNETFGWIGSLDSLKGGKGYWLCSDVDMYYNWDAENCEGTLSRKAEQSTAIPTGYEYNQSTTQAFYFLEEISGINNGDWILSFNGDVVIGAREWQGNIIDVPAMGDDGSDFTKGYMEAGKAPQFKIL
jgi:hypothetical protein